MTIVSILQDLWRRRVLVAIAFVVSVALGLTLVYQVGSGGLKSRDYTVGIATVRVLVDTPDSVVADLNPSGAASLSLHAQLLADLVSSQSIREAIADKVGVPVQDLAVVPPAIAGSPAVPTPVATAQIPPSAASTITLQVDSTLPLVSISAQAPTESRADTLANGAVTALRSYLGSVAEEQKIPAFRQPVLRSLGTQLATQVKGPSRMLGAGAAFVVFALICYLIVFIDGLRRKLRAARVRQEQGFDDEAGYDEELAERALARRRARAREDRLPLDPDDEYGYDRDDRVPVYASFSHDRQAIELTAADLGLAGLEPPLAPAGAEHSEPDLDADQLSKAEAADEPEAAQARTSTPADNGRRPAQHGDRKWRVKKAGSLLDRG